MWWNALAGAAQGYNHGQATNAVIEANNRISVANAEASNKVRTARNAATAAQNSLARWVQSVNNNRLLDSGGDALEANIVNYRRASDAGLHQSFSASISEAEQQGAAAAAAAFSGVGGNVVDMVNGSTALRDSLVRQRVSDIAGMQNYDAARRAGNIMTQTIGGMDNSLILDTLDFNVDVAQIEATTNKFALALIGAAQHMGGGQSIDAGRGAAETKYNSAVGQGLAIRQSSSSQYDLADYAEANKAKFSFKTYDISEEEYSPYSLYQSDRKVDLRTREDTSSFWSR